MTSILPLFLGITLGVAMVVIISLLAINPSQTALRHKFRAVANAKDREAFLKMCRFQRVVRL